MLYLRPVNLVTTDENAIGKAIADGQAHDPELQYFFTNTKHRMTRRVIGEHTVRCDDMFRPYLPTNMRFSVFQQLHNMAHPGASATLRLVKDEYTWPGVNKQVRQWAKECQNCQRAKVHRHTKAPLGEIPTTARFHTVHIDLVGPLPSSHGFRYLATMIDRFTNWIEVVPIADMQTETVANAFLSEWISRFGVPRVLISDRGKQFESAIWANLMDKLSIKRKRTTSYHPQANGAIERFHRTIKNSLRASCALTSQWYDKLPLVLLGIRSAVNRSGYSPAQLVYGQNIDLPIDYFAPRKPQVNEPDSEFVNKLFKAVAKFPAPERNHDSAHYVPRDFTQATHVWMRDIAPESSLSPRYYRTISHDIHR